MCLHANLFLVILTRGGGGGFSITKKLLHEFLLPLLNIPQIASFFQVLPDRDSAAIEEIRGEIGQLREILQNQQREQNVKVSEVLREEVAVLEGAISTRLETILSQHNAEQGTCLLLITRFFSSYSLKFVPISRLTGHLLFLDQVFEKFTRDKQVNEKQRHEKMTTSITTAVLNKVEKTVKNEIRNSVGSSECLIKFYLIMIFMIFTKSLL